METPPPAPSPEPTEAEARVRVILATEGTHVVHFWAPWCGNSIRELEGGWKDLVGQHPEASFTFVTVWNDGESGRDVMDAHGLPGRVVEVTQPDFGPKEEKHLRRRTFLGLPVTWIPSTWVFRAGGELAFALNYGEARMETLSMLIEDAQRSW